jgi:c-di-GMP-related signal transduction protein
MKEVLSEIPLDEVIKNALLGLPSRFRTIFDVVLDYESGTWKHLEHSARAIGLHKHFLPDLYLQSLKWVNEILLETSLAV